MANQNKPIWEEKSHILKTESKELAIEGDTIEAKILQINEKIHIDHEKNTNKFISKYPFSI